MEYLIKAPSALEYFSTLVSQDEGLPLFEAAVSIAVDEYPDLDMQQVLADLDRMQDRLRRRLPNDAGALQRLRVLNVFFFNDLGFSGNVNHYSDPDNSYLNVVMHTRRGIPITLAVLWLELAQGIGLQAQGVNFPGHFMVKVHLPQGQVILDPFTGQSLSRDDLAERLEPFKRRNGLIDDFDVPVGLYLQSASHRDILARMLRNLKQIYQIQEDAPRLRQVLDRMLVLLPEAWDERRDRGYLLADLGEISAALQDLELYLLHRQDAADVDLIAERVRHLRHMQG